MGSVAAAPPPSVSLRPVASGLSQPLEITHAGDGSARLFIVEKGGLIRILRSGGLLAAPFLDVQGLISASGERGLLGLAFHPQFAANRRFFVFYTQRSDGALRISSFLASAGDADVADAGSEREILTIPHPSFANHNGGRIAFGPDGYLYIGVGDGGSSGDPSNNAQDLSKLLGKLLRIDVDTASGYGIPPDNPFAGRAGARAEIWAYGLRNPWKFTFDRATGDLYIGDVGQGAVEEVDFIARGSDGGFNFGWRVFEGSDCFIPSAGCSLADHTPPVVQYRHAGQTGRSVTGGYVYRGLRSAQLRGFYVYGDFVSSRVWAALREGSVWTSYVFIEPELLSGISSFGEDEAGELYVASFSDGRVYAIDATGPAVNPMARPDSVACPDGALAAASGNPLLRLPGPPCRGWGLVR